MDITWYLPCQPHWLCAPFMTTFTLLLLIGVILFIRIIIKEYQRIKRLKAIVAKRHAQHRRVPAHIYNARYDRRGVKKRHY